MDAHNLFGYTTLGASASSAVTTITLASSAAFPDPASVGAYNAVIWPVNTKPVLGNAEVVRVTAKSGLTYTITRAQEGSTAFAFAAGDEIANAVTPKVLTDIETAIADHIADSADAHDASAISIADAANDFTATDVEGALAELQSDAEADAQALSDHIADTTDAHDASAISVSPSGNLAADDVQEALTELQTDVDGRADFVLIFALGGY